MFLNETLHPKAPALYNHLCLCAMRDEHGDTDFYQPLVVWRQAQDMSEEKAADLYARIAEGFDGFYTEGSGTNISKLSKFLWANDKAVMQ